MVRMLVATDDGLHVFAEPGAEPAVELDGHRVSAISAHRNDRWAIVDHDRVWHDDGAGWSELATVDGLSATCLAWTVALLVGTSEAHLLRAGETGLEPVTAFDRAAGRSDWYTPWGGPPDTRSITEWDDDVYVNVHVGGILRTSDAGASWEPTIDIDADVHQVTAAEGHVLAACASGLAASTDRGVNWSTRDDGLERVYARAVAISGDAVLLSASDGPRGGHAAVYRGAVADGPLERCTDEPFDGNIDSHCLDALPDGTAAAFGTADGRLFASVDEGATWQDAGTVPGAVRSVLLI